MAKKVKLNPYRVTLQWIFILLLGYLLVRPYIDKTYTADFEAYCPFGGLQAFSSFLVNNSLACSMTTTQIFMGFALIAAILLVSKLFCSYVCPIGSFTEWLARMGRKLKLNIVIKGWPDKALRLIKYALLFLTFYFTVTSSELFCKTFDPYYAVFSGFSSDVIISYAVMALLVAIPGSFFIRQFWCKYFCPLGAVSNIITHSYIFAGLIAVYLFFALVLKLSISWIWLLAALTLTGVLLEIFRFQVTGISVLKISRNSESCTNCKLCDKACPMSVKVSTVDKVNDIDCHLCGDCVTNCPEKNTLKILNKLPLESNKAGVKRNAHLWIPAAIVILLVALGLSFAEKVHIPTISLMWGNNAQIHAAGIYDQEGLKSIKCFGSSMSFANHMKEVPGVLGVETYVGKHGVRVWYDKSLLTSEEIKQAIFNPVKSIYEAPDPVLKEIGVFDAAIDNFFDPNDANNLGLRFMQNKGILGMETRFGEPVHAVIYYDENLIKPDKIKELIEAKRVEWIDETGNHAAKTDFKVAEFETKEKCPISKYLTLVYETVAMTFNGFEDYKPEELDTLKLAFPQGTFPELVEMPWYLLSHLSNDRGVVSFSTIASENGMMLEIVIVREKTSFDAVKILLNAGELIVHMNDGTVQKIKNPYRF
ncbi:MAG TPA: 4Fe-4S binding protein [Lentimicrobium sp.]|nr:4Fe-4S binding protein [Lentimicrobium sp.]